MLKKIDLSKKVGNGHISILYPGTVLSESDSGFHTIGRIDHANIQSGAVVKMHPHVNDDILSYFRKGKVRHTDSEGFEEYITPTRLMLMKAGKLFYHEEAILQDNEGLQIFIRPGSKDSVPEVIFEDLNEMYVQNSWRLIASPDKMKTKLNLSSRTWIYDTELTAGKTIRLPEGSEDNLGYLLYVYQGGGIVDDWIKLSKGESLFITDENITFSTLDGAILVLFATDMSAEYYDGGMYSGNKKKN